MNYNLFKETLQLKNILDCFQSFSVIDDVSVSIFICCQKQFKASP